MVMSENEWYESNEHFNTEMDYDEYLKKNKNKLTPSFDELMRM